MTKDILATDIDSVLDDIMPALNDHYNRTHRTNFTLRDYVYYDLEKVWGGTKEDAVKVVTDFYNSPDFDAIKPVEFSQEAIKILSEAYRIISITSRPEFTRAKTERKFRERYPQIEKIFFTGDYSKSFEKMSKIKICKGQGARIIIDDHPLIALECSRNGLASILFGDGGIQNISMKGIKLDGVIPAKNWKEALNYLI